MNSNLLIVGNVISFFLKVFSTRKAEEWESENVAIKGDRCNQRLR